MKQKFFSLTVLGFAFMFGGHVYAADTFDWTSASVKNPLDVSGLLTNSDFASNITGWTCVYTKEGNPNKSAGYTWSNYQTVSRGFVGSGYLKMWHWNSTGMYNTGVYQDATGLEKGIYLVSAIVGASNQYRKDGSGNRMNQHPGFNFFANSDSVTVTASDIAAKRFHIVQPNIDGKLRVGFWMTSQNDNDCAGFDDVQLTYYGKGSDAVDMLSDSLNKSFSALSSGSGTFSPYAYENTNNAISNIKLSDNDFDAAMAKYQLAKVSISDFSANVSAWIALSAQIATAETTTNPSQGVTDELTKAKAMVDDQTATTAEIVAETNAIAAQLRYSQTQSFKNGTDATWCLQNADFSTTAAVGFPYWTASNGFTSNSNYTGVQVSNIDFELYQNVNNMKAGIYCLTAPYFMKMNSATSESDYAAYKNNGQNVTAYVYMNNSIKKACNFYDGASSTDLSTGNSAQMTDGKFLPSNFPGAVAWEDDASALYTNKVYSVCEGSTTGGTLKIGFGNKNTYKTNYWSVWRALKLTFVGDDVAAVASALTGIEPQITALKTKALPKSVKDDLTTAYDNAKKATGSNADALAAFKTLTEKLTTAYQSLDSYFDLTAANDTLASAIVKYATTADATALTTAKTINADVIKALADGTYSVADAEAKITDVQIATTNLRKPAGEPTSSTQGVDYTSLIVNPSFVDGQKGWTGNTADNLFNSWLNLRTNAGNWDLNQTITGIPNGYYKLSMQGFTKTTDASETQDAMYKDGSYKNYKNECLLYANEVQTPVLNILDEPLDADATNLYLKETVGDKEILRPGDNVVSDVTYSLEEGVNKKYWDAGFFKNNVVIVNVTNHTLTVGAKYVGGIANWPWTAINGFSLFYYGSFTPNSNAEYTGIDNAVINSDEIASKMIFGIDGVRKSNMSKGINIVKVIAKDGRTKTYKILVR